MNIVQVRDQAILRLQQAGQDLASAQVDALWLLADVLGKPTSWLYTFPEAALDKSQQLRFERLLNERLSGVPVAYLIGEVGFWRLRLKVNRTTLIPRPDTELLVSTALTRAPQHEHVAVLDLGTGTGAIALALAQERPHWSIRGYDRIDEAVSLARDNAVLNGLSQVAFACHDWHQPLPAWPCDLVVSNPPYIDHQDPHLTQGDVRFEPRSALVSADSGLADLSAVIARASAVLKPTGLLLLEHGYNQGEAVHDLLSVAGFQDLISERDLQGHWRVSGGSWPGSL